MKKDIKDWETLNLKKDDFDATALDHMICESIRVEKKDEHYKCTTEETAAVVDVLPQNQAEYTETQKVRHFTFVFNIFVFLQVFNIINSRKIQGEKNVFSDFFNNCLFIVVIIVTIVVQILIIEVGSMATKTVAFNMYENLFCIGLGATSLIWGFFLKFIPTRFFQWVSLDDAPMDEEESQKTLTSKLKTVRGVSGKKRQEVETYNAMMDLGVSDDKLKNALLGKFQNRINN